MRVLGSVRKFEIQVGDSNIECIQYWNPQPGSQIFSPSPTVSLPELIKSLTCVLNGLTACQVTGKDFQKIKAKKNKKKKKALPIQLCSMSFLQLLQSGGSTQMIPSCPFTQVRGIAQDFLHPSHIFILLQSTVLNK